MANPNGTDVYDDPDNILNDTDNSVSGATELPQGTDTDLSQSILTPEKEAPGDDRGPIPELERADGGPEADSEHLGDMDTADEHDDTEA